MGSKEGFGLNVFLRLLSFGGLLCYSLSNKVDLVFLVPSCCGNSYTIAASDLIPEIKPLLWLEEKFFSFNHVMLGAGILLILEFTASFTLKACFWKFLPLIKMSIRPPVIFLVNAVTWASLVQSWVINM